MTFEGAATLNRQQRLRFLNDTKQMLVSSPVAAERAWILFRDMEANGAEPCVALQIQNRCRQSLGLSFRLTEQEKGQPGCRLIADAREFGQFCH